ncbi:MAG: hypothetical protein IPP93_01200 [Chitinophagaceae bacterium]|nr:hypothetical protein [Chitinophagaceae bacterium]MBL0336276.1 hypothetical protein [Chitinophagaceae bacterium]
MSDKNKTLKKGLDKLRDILDRLAGRQRPEPVPSVYWAPQSDRKMPPRKA